MTAGPVDVLVVGAGPTGLALALQVHDHGGSVRVVEKRPEAFRPSRAMVLHPRTLELLRPRGVTDALLARGDPAAAARLHLGSRRVLVDTAALDLAGTPFPHLVLIRQAVVEEVLSRAVAERGIDVDRGCALTGLGATGGQPHATVSRSGTIERIAYRYLVGCDGVGSTVRRLGGIAWPGCPYREEILLADLDLAGELAGDPAAVRVFAGRDGVLFLFAGGELARWRLLATRPANGRQPANGRRPAPDVDLQALLDGAGVPARITAVGWSTRIRPERRLAADYRSGRLFLAGDAAHCHTPAAAQGMNTGIQDALNLGWKLAVAAHSRSDSSPLLDSYQLERRPVARRVIGLTHAVFWAEASGHPVASFLRGSVTPLAAPALPALLRRRRLLACGLRQLAGFGVHYRDSPLTIEAAPHRPGPKAGDRLPDGIVTVGGSPIRLHELLAPPGIHLLLQREALPGGQAAELDRCWSGQRLHPHRVSSWAGAGAVLVRPDGYLGLRAATADLATIRRWLNLLTS